MLAAACLDRELVVPGNAADRAADGGGTPEQELAAAGLSLEEQPALWSRLWESFVALWDWYTARGCAAVWGVVDDLLGLLAVFADFRAAVLGDDGRRAKLAAVVANTAARMALEYGSDAAPRVELLKAFDQLLEWRNM
jgi:hypothetical protein